jgi:hypothetical protein
MSNTRKANWLKSYRKKRKLDNWIKGQGVLDALRRNYIDSLPENVQYEEQLRSEYLRLGPLAPAPLLLINDIKRWWWGFRKRFHGVKQYQLLESGEDVTVLTSRSSFQVVEEDGESYLLDTLGKEPLTERNFKSFYLRAIGYQQLLINKNVIVRETPWQ